jgi:hypothetical protein
MILGSLNNLTHWLTLLSLSNMIKKGKKEMKSTQNQNW